MDDTRQDLNSLPKIEIRPMAVYTADEAAAVLMRSTKTIYNLVKSGRLRGAGGRKGYRILGKSLMDYLLGDCS